MSENTSFSPSDIAVIVLYHWAKYYRHWSIETARHMLERRYVGAQFEPEVTHALKRAAYTWADAISEEIMGEMLETYYACDTAIAA